MKFFILLMLLSSSAWSMDSSKCSGMLNNGLYKKYKWAGIGESNAKAMTAETKSSNIASATSKISSDNSTALLDPKYSSNVSTSGTQSLSSWGQCSPFALQERKEQRELYVAQNLDQIKKDVANGTGPHLEVLSWYSLCEDKAQADFNQALQKDMKKLLNSDSTAFTKNVDQLIKENQRLIDKCFVLSAK